MGQFRNRTIPAIQINAVPTLVEQYQLVIPFVVDFIASGSRKSLLNRGFLKNRNAENLQNRKEAAVQIEALLNNGDQNINRDCRPDLSFDGVL
jgi:cytochrome oxidase assembly protein ShyY1